MAKDSLFHYSPKLGHQVIVFGYNNELQSNSTSGHFSTTATSLQRSLYFVPLDSLNLVSYLNLSTMATNACPQLPK